MDNVIVATVKEWNIKNYFDLKNRFLDQYNFILISDKDELSAEQIKEISPKYIFFPHWSWMIPKEIYDVYECIVFHMTDLPFGRGGSPFQNLIIQEIYNTKISALKVDSGIDTGDIYLKENFNISNGSAEENFIQLSHVIFTKMIPEILEGNIEPSKQEGEGTSFQRRRPEDSDICTIKEKSISKLFDFIRMLDAEGYPKANLKLDGVKFEFSEVHLKNNKLVGRFEVAENE